MGAGNAGHAWVAAGPEGRAVALAGLVGAGAGELARAFGTSPALIAQGLDPASPVALPPAAAEGLERAWALAWSLVEDAGLPRLVAEAGGLGDPFCVLDSDAALGEAALSALGGALAPVASAAAASLLAGVSAAAGSCVVVRRGVFAPEEGPLEAVGRLFCPGASGPFDAAARAARKALGGPAAELERDLTLALGAPWGAETAAERSAWPLAAALQTLAADVGSAAWAASRPEGPAGAPMRRVVAPAGPDAAWAPDACLVAALNKASAGAAAMEGARIAVERPA